MFEKYRHQMALLLCCTLFCCSAAVAATSDCVSFQGKLTGSSGVPIPDGAYDMVFKFYDAAAGGNLLVTDRHLGASGGAVQVTGGVYSTLLGGGSIVAGTESGLSSVFVNHSEVYVGVTVGADAEMTPRILLTRSPYAIKAEDASTLGGLAASDFLDTTSTAQVKIGRLGLSGSVSGSAILEAANADTSPNSYGLSGSSAGDGVAGVYATSTHAAGIGLKSMVTSSDSSIVAVNKGSGLLIKGMSGMFGTNTVFQVAVNGDTTVSGTGRIIASNYTFPAALPKTGKLVISPADMVPGANDQTIAPNPYRMWGWQYGGSKENVFYLQATQASQFAVFYAPVHLPDGAKITKLSVGINDTDPATQSEVRLSRFTIFGDSAEHLVTATSVDGTPMLEVPVNNCVVSNDGYYYVLGLKLYCGQSGSVTFTGAVIEYTYTDLKN